METTITSRPTVHDSAVLELSDLSDSIKRYQRSTSKVPVTGQGLARSKTELELPYVYAVEKTRTGLRLRLHYTPPVQAASPTELLIDLKSNQPGFGGQRWWLSCPTCRQRKAKLFLAPQTDHFACKACHKLA